MRKVLDIEQIVLRVLQDKYESNQIPIKLAKGAICNGVRLTKIEAAEILRVLNNDGKIKINKKYIIIPRKDYSGVES